MKVTLKLSNFYKDHLKSYKNEQVLKLNKSVTIKKILETSGINIQKVPSIIMVNGVFNNTDYKLKDGDEIFILPAFRGG